MTIVTPLEVFAFTTVEKVKQQGSGIAPADSTQDDAIRFLINAFCDLAMRRSSRELVTTTTGSTLRTFPVKPIQVYGELAAFVDFGRFDAQTVTAVSVNTQSTSPFLLTTDQYQPVPVEKWDGVYTGINITGTAVAPASLPGLTVTADVTGTWGWPVVPDIIVRDCVETVKTWLKLGYQYQGTTGIPGETGGQVAIWPPDLPTSVQEHLDNIQTIRMFC